MIEELGECVGEHLADTDNNERHHDPFGNFKEQVFLDDVTEAKAKNKHDHGDRYRRPKHETLAKCSDVHSYCFYTSPIPIPKSIAPASRSALPRLNLGISSLFIAK